MKPTLPASDATRLVEDLDRAARKVTEMADVDAAIVLGVRMRNGRLQVMDGHTDNLTIEQVQFILAAMIDAYERRGITVTDDSGNTSTFDVEGGDFSERKPQ